MKLSFRLPYHAALSAALIAGLLLSAGCEHLPSRQQAPDGRAVPASGPAANDGDLSTALDLMQEGRIDQADAVLARLAKTSPESEVIVLLRSQIETPAEQLLPGPYREIQVQPGDSLSRIAQRELGDPLLFYALGRLNGIDVPRLLGVGTTLRVPRRQSADGGTGEPVVHDRPAVDAADLASVAEYLVASGRPEAARKVLLSSMHAGEVPDGARELLLDLTLDQALARQNKGEFESAGRILAEAGQVLVDSDSVARLEFRAQKIRAEQAYQSALDLQSNGNLLAAYTAVRGATSIDAERADAARLETALRRAIIDDLHDQALRAWRDRDVDTAIETWQKLVEVIPDFEPARIYLDRALRLRQRLDNYDAAGPPQAEATSLERY